MGGGCAYGGPRKLAGGESRKRAIACAADHPRLKAAFRHHSPFIGGSTTAAFAGWSAARAALRAFAARQTRKRRLCRRHENARYAGLRKRQRTFPATVPRITRVAWGVSLCGFPRAHWLGLQWPISGSKRGLQLSFSGARRGTQWPLSLGAV